MSIRRRLAPFLSLCMLAVAVPGAAAQTPVTVYSSLPLQGASKDQTQAAVRGAKLAVRQAAGTLPAVSLRYVSLDDSTKRAGNWDPNRVARNARRAAGDPSTVAYIGEFNSGASALSIPILNEAGIAQVSPSNTYDGLTAESPGTDRGEPAKYYPTGVRTFVRILPRDAVQARAIAAKMQQDGCKRIAIADDRETYGAGIAKTVAIEAARAGSRSSAGSAPSASGATSPRPAASAPPVPGASSSAGSR